MSDGICEGTYFILILKHTQIVFNCKSNLFYVQMKIKYECKFVCEIVVSINSSASWASILKIYDKI